MNEAIRIAIEKGGYKLFGALDKPLAKYSIDFYSGGIGVRRLLVSVDWANRGTDGRVEKKFGEANENDIASDPLFWQALGKALAWDGKRWICMQSHKTEWQCEAHRYFDLLLTGGDVEAFWKGLLNDLLE